MGRIKPIPGKRYIILLIIVILLVLNGVLLFVSDSRNQTEKAMSNDTMVEVVNENDKVNQLIITGLDETLNDCIPGIVCWGDSLTARGWPKDFELILKEGVLSPLNKEIQMIIAEYRINIPVINMGVGSETSAMITARSGAEPYKIASEIIIPENCSEIDIDIVMSDGTEARNVKFGWPGLERVSINGIDGTISSEFDGMKIVAYKFKRKEPGKAMVVDAGTNIITNGAVLYQNYIPVIFMGTNGGYGDDPKELIRQQQAIIDYSTSPAGKYIIVGLHTGNKDIRNNLENAMENAWGDHYINLREYLSTNALNEMGIEATSEDIEMMKNGETPASLLEADGLHFTSTGYQIIAQLVYDRMMQLHFFDEIFDAVDKVVSEYSVK